MTLSSVPGVLVESKVTSAAVSRLASYATASQGELAGRGFDRGGKRETPFPPPSQPTTQICKPRTPTCTQQRRTLGRLTR